MSIKKMTNFVKTMILFGIISSIIYNIFNLKFADKFLFLKDGLLLIDITQ